MRMVKHVVAVIFAIPTLSGCPSLATKQFVPLPDQARRVEDSGLARIYVLRVSKLTIYAGEVRDGDTLIGSLGPDAYLCWERQPGELLLRSSFEHAVLGIRRTSHELRLSVDAGSVHYVMQQWRRRDGVSTKLAVLSEEYGSKILAKCKSPAVVAE